MCNAYNHPPGCTCGWGGEGHAGTTFGSNTLSFISSRIPVDDPIAVTFKWREGEFTHPTICPECGADVYFIRHNGGSVWVDPPLGWPWSKHACFDQPTTPTHNFSLWTERTSGFPNAKLGIITRIKNYPTSSEPLLEIHLPDSSSVSMVIRSMPSEPLTMGELVLVSEEDNLLLHPVHAEIPFHSFFKHPAKSVPDNPPKNDLPKIYCLRCHTFHIKGGEQHITCSAKLGNKLSHKKVHRNREGTNAPRKSPRPSMSALQIVAQLSAAGEAQQLRMANEVERISKTAWEAASRARSAEEGLSLAKQESMRLIERLSPWLKRQVHHYFTSNKWAPLISRKPK